MHSGSTKAMIVVVRDEKELNRIIWYTINNPVKAGLVKMQRTGNGVIMQTRNKRFKNRVTKL